MQIAIIMFLILVVIFIVAMFVGESDVRHRK